MGPAVRAPPKSSCALKKKKKPASFDETLERDDRSSLSIPPAPAAAPPLAASPPASAAASSAELPPSSVSSSAPSAPASRGSGALSLEVLLLHEADDLVGDADVLDRVSTDVAVRHAPEPIAVLARADDLLEVHVHPRVAAHEVAVVRLAVLELDELIDLIRRWEGERRGSGVGGGGVEGVRVSGRRGGARKAPDRARRGRVDAERHAAAAGVARRREGGVRPAGSSDRSDLVRARGRARANARANRANAGGPPGGTANESARVRAGCPPASERAAALEMPRTEARFACVDRERGGSEGTRGGGDDDAPSDGPGRFSEAREATSSSIDRARRDPIAAREGVRSMERRRAAVREPREGSALVCPGAARAEAFLGN